VLLFAQVRVLFYARSSEEGGIHARMRCLLTSTATSRGGACRLLSMSLRPDVGTFCFVRTACGESSLSRSPFAWPVYLLTNNSLLGLRRLSIRYSRYLVTYCLRRVFSRVSFHVNEVRTRENTLRRPRSRCNRRSTHHQVNYFENILQKLLYCNDMISTIIVVFHI